jgi:ABC-type glycerol-3-phosphate transport system substrate-binding protein
MKKIASAWSILTRRQTRIPISKANAVILSLVYLALGAMPATPLAEAADALSAVTKSLPKTFKGATVNFPLPSGPAPEAYIKVTKEFEEATGIEVNFTILSYQELHQKLILDLTSGSNSFDALMFAYQWKREIDPYMADLNALSQQVAGAPALVLEDYPQRALQIYGAVDGKLMGLPVLGDATLILWNVDSYERAGLDPKAAPGSWDEIYERGAQIAKSGQTFGYGLPAGKSIQATVTWILLFNAFGGKYFDSERKPLFDSEAGIKAMEFMVSKLAKISPPGITTWDFPEMFTAFATGQTAQTMMWPGGLGGLSDPAQSQVAGRFRWCSPPGGSLLGGWACGVNKSSANREAAYAYCAWLTSPEIVRKAAQYGGAPCRVSSLQDPELVEKFPYYPAILEGMNHSIEYPPVKEAEDIHILVYNQVNAAVSGEKSATQAAHDLQQSVLELMTRRGYYHQK